MLTIIISVLIAGALFYFTAIHMEDVLLAAISILLGLLGVFVAIFAPLSGYEESIKTSEIELVSLSNTIASEGSGRIYVSVNAENVYSYRYEVESDVVEKEGKTYKANTISSSDGEILEVETTDGSAPMLVKYVAKGKRSIWTFAVACEKATYIFYVPEGTIVKDVILN